MELKKQIIKCLVWSVALYAAETWTLTQADRSKLEAFEMWIWRRMEKISSVDKKTNEDILNNAAAALVAVSVRLKVKGK